MSNSCRPCGCAENYPCGCDNCFIINFACAVSDSISKFTLHTDQLKVENALLEAHEQIKTYIQNSCFETLCEKIKETNGCLDGCWQELFLRIKVPLLYWAEFYYVRDNRTIDFHNYKVSTIAKEDDYNNHLKNFIARAKRASTNLVNYMEADDCCFECCYLKKGSNKYHQPRSEWDFDFLNDRNFC